MAHRQRVKQLLDTDCRPSGPWEWGFLGNFPIVIKHQSSPNLRRRVAGRNGDVTGRECQGWPGQSDQVLAIRTSHAHFLTSVLSRLRDDGPSEIIKRVQMGEGSS